MLPAEQGPGWGDGDPRTLHPLQGHTHTAQRVMGMSEAGGVAVGDSLAVGGTRGRRHTVSLLSPKRETPLGPPTPLFAQRGQIKKQIFCVTR